MGGWDYTLFEISRARAKVFGEFSAAGGAFKYRRVVVTGTIYTLGGYYGYLLRSWDEAMLLIEGGGCHAYLPDIAPHSASVHAQRHPPVRKPPLEANELGTPFIETRSTEKDLGTVIGVAEGAVKYVHM